MPEGQGEMKSSDSCITSLKVGMDVLSDFRALIPSPLIGPAPHPPAGGSTDAVGSIRNPKPAFLQ